MRIDVDHRADRTILRWEPCREPSFWSYELYRMDRGTPVGRLTPEPLRSATWTDARPDAAEASYGVRVVSASGVASPFVTWSATVDVNARVLS
jgi:hypothetical protein